MRAKPLVLATIKNFLNMAVFTFIGSIIFFLSCICLMKILLNLFNYKSNNLLCEIIVNITDEHNYNNRHELFLLETNIENIELSSTVNRGNSNCTLNIDILATVGNDSKN